MGPSRRKISFANRVKPRSAAQSLVPASLVRTLTNWIKSSQSPGFSSTPFRPFAVAFTLGPLILAYLVIANRSVPPGLTSPRPKRDDPSADYEAASFPDAEADREGATTSDDGRDTASAEQGTRGAEQALTQGSVLVMEGEYYRRNGDYDTASEKFRTVISAYPGTREAADAYLGLAETYNLDRRFKAAIETLQEFLQQFPYEPRVNRALFCIANNYKALGRSGA